MNTLLEKFVGWAAARRYDITQDDQGRFKSFITRILWEAYQAGNESA